MSENQANTASPLTSSERLSSLRDSAQRWAASDPDPNTQRETLELLAREDREASHLLQERFGERLSFGTAGLRGPVSFGPNAMNCALVRRVSLALGLHLRAQHNGADTRQRVVIGFDARHGSTRFAEEAARALGGLGFEVHLATTVSPTPLLAHAVCDLKAVAGVMVTASHNPPQDNGFKVYWGNGAQIIPPHDKLISAQLDEVGDGSRYPRPSLDELRASGHIQDLSSAQGERYEQALLEARLGSPALARALKLTYTAMHGVGASWYERVMRAGGFEALSFVQAQREPDPDFPTVSFPNPEEPGALDLALACAEAEGAHLLLAHDPDADRLAVVARDKAGALRAFTGDQLGALIAHELFEVLPLKGEPLNAQQLVATTIVSSSLLGVMAEANGVQSQETLTGFKWIANAALAHEAEGGRFLFGYEEAIGYSVGALVRDKDGVSAALFVADMAARALAEGKTLWDRLDEVYQRYGVFVSSQVNRVRPGTAGKEEISGWMRSLREAPPQELAGLEVTERTDFAELPAPMTGDVLRYRLAGGGRVIVRPSGTEPKIKVYLEARATLTDEAEGGLSPLDEARARAHDQLHALTQAVETLLS